MENITKKLLLFGCMAAMVTGLTNCTQHDQVLDLQTPPSTTGAGTVLTSIKGSPKVLGFGEGTWDGTIETMWDNAPKLTVSAAVPDLGNGTFAGFVGNSNTVTMRSCYDANNIYYLVQYPSTQYHVQSAQWYYNPTTRLWAQEATAPTQNSDGTWRPAAAQEQFVIMFNVANNPCPLFKTLSCYAACHSGTSFSGTVPPGGYMYTNGPTEVLDVWRARFLQVINANQINDCFIDDGSSVGLGLSGTYDKNEVHGDWQVNNGSSASVPPSLQSKAAADGGFSNKISLTVTGKKNKVSVPWYVFPSGVYQNSAIMLSDTGTKAIRVVAVDTNGVLTLANGATIDPRTGTGYQQMGSWDGPNCIPGSVVGPYTGSRGDVSANGFFTGSEVRILLKRALTTSDIKYDVDFKSLADQPFGIGVMYNGADNQHAIAAGLTLTFKK